MAVPKAYLSDVDTILAKRYVNGGDLWATADGRLGVGSPFSTLQCALMLSEMGYSEPILKETAELILGSWREDGRFRLAPKGALYPCYTATAARVLCRLGYTNDSRLKRTFDHLLEIQHTDGGWRCNTYKFGRGPETEYSNPGPTLEALDAFRFSQHLNREKALDKAVEFLLKHWDIRKPIGPCHFGIGSRFMKVEYPFFRYNLFLYVYVLSFYNRAKEDSRFQQAFKLLESKVTAGKVIVEHTNPKLKGLSFCKIGAPSDAATVHYEKILENLGG